MFPLLQRFLLAAALISSPATSAYGAGSGFSCSVSLGITEPFLSIGRLELSLLYAPGAVTIVGSGGQVACSGLVMEVGGGKVAAAFDDDDQGTVFAAFVSEAGFPGFTPLALCHLTAGSVVDADDFSIVLIRSLTPGGAPTDPQPAVQVAGVDCTAGTTTTLDTVTTTSTTTSSTTLGVTTTTTLPPTATCGDPNGSGGLPTASDSLFVLNASVGLVLCAPQICDVDSSGIIAATDALRVLRAAVGLGGILECPA